MRNEPCGGNGRAPGEAHRNTGCWQAVRGRRRSAARLAMLAVAVVAGYVPGAMAGDLGPLCPLPGYSGRRCPLHYQCCLEHTCCHEDYECCTGTFGGVTRETCIDPDLADCCSGVGIIEDYICCNDPALNNNGAPYGCPPGDYECCDGGGTNDPNLICTPPEHKCCHFGTGQYAPDAGKCCTDDPWFSGNYVCMGGQDCCKGACCGGDYPTCCQDIPDPPAPASPYQGYCCQAGEGCCQGECCGADTPVCCTDGTDPFDPRYCCETGEACCGGVCCAGECLPSPLGGKKCCDPGFTKLCVNAGQATCCDGECCGPDGQEICCEADRHCCPIGPPSCGPVGACCLDNEGTCTEVDQACCERMEGIAWAQGVPCDSSLCLPVCDNCQEYQRTFDECLHWATDPDGTACRVDACIHNVFCSASCTHHDGRIGPPHCDTDTIWGLPEVCFDVTSFVVC